MTVEVEIGGRIHRVELERDGARWVATLGGRTIEVDVAPAGPGLSLLIGSRAGDEGNQPAAESYDLTLDGRNAGEWLVSVDGQPVPARIVDPRAWRRGDRRGSSTARDSRTVTSAMPGRVVRVLVKAGDRVAERQPLVVVEAMKMENELRAPADAVVREITVAEGASVEAGAILIVLE